MPVNKYCKFLIIDFQLKRKKLFFLQNSIAGENGESGKASDGINGYNSVGIKVPEIVPFHPIQFINDYTDYMRMGSEHLFRKSYFQAFLKQLSESQTIRLLIDKYQSTLDIQLDKTENRDDIDHFVIN